jgi:hypothetical protein
MESFLKPNTGMVLLCNLSSPGNVKKGTMIDDVGNPDPDLGQPQKMCGLNS